MAGSAGALLTVLEAAERLRCGERTIWTLIQNGELRSLKIGRHRMVPEAEIDRFVAVRLAT